MSTDPVCGMELQGNDIVTSLEYNGVTYHFCSAECRRRFEAKPQAYTQ